MNFFSKFDGSAEFGSAGLLPRAQPHVDTVSTKAPADAILVQDANLLFNGDFKRSGSDLVISKDDRQLVLADYFKGEKHAPLASVDGAYLTGKIVDALTGHVQYAQADGSASAAKLIGHVTKISGSATAIRNGVSIILNQGDNVYQGDVVQAGSNSTLGITFIDGSVFGLASNAKMVLNEMIYDPNNGSSNSALMSLVQGTISFVSGATAKHGDMKVDTPVATMGIRGTAVLVEIDFVIPLPQTPLPVQPLQPAPPARFQVLVEPDGTTGSYVLLDKVTLAPIATVNQPGTTTTVSGQGIVTFLPTATLSLDAQRIISEVFTMKFTDNTNPKTNAVFTDTVIPQTTAPIRLASGDFVTATVFLANVGSNATKPLSSGGNALDHLSIAPDIATSDATMSERSNLTGSSLTDKFTGSISYADINAGDIPTVSTKYSSFKYQNAQGVDVTAGLSAEQLAAIKQVTLPLLVEQDPSLKNFGTAHWTYSVADGALDFLAAGEKLILTYIGQVDSNFAPDNLTSTKTFTITISGTNDAPTVTATSASFTEHSGTIPPLIDHVTGTITFADVDLTDRPQASASVTSFTYLDADGHDISGTLTPQQLAAIAAVEPELVLTPNAGNTHGGTVGWSYQIADNKFDFLSDDEILTLTYTATVNDGHGGVATAPFTITIIGTSSPAFPITEIEGQTGDTAAIDTAAGTVPFKQVDLAHIEDLTYHLASTTWSGGDTLPDGLTDQLAAAFVAKDTGSGSVHFDFGIPDATFDFLAEGETLTIVYSLTVTDTAGAFSTKSVTILVIGTNDAPTITATTTPAQVTGAVVEDGTLVATGTITFQDVDLIDTHLITPTLSSGTASKALPGFNPMTDQLGTFELAPHEDNTDTNNLGTVGWTFTLNNALAQQLAVGQVITQTYTVTIDDQHGGIITQPVTVTIAGTNDAPTITATKATGSVTEDVNLDNSGHITSTGSFAFTDVDLIDVHSATATLLSSTTNCQLPGYIDNITNIGTLTFNVNESTDTIKTGSIDWTFSLDNSNPLLQALDEGQTITQTYLVKISDGHVTIDEQVTITIIGTHDGPLIAVAPVSGVEGSPIHLDLTLFVPQSSLGSLVISDIPIGAVLSDGQGHSFTAAAGSTSVDVIHWSLSDLSITPANDINFALDYLATANSGASTDVDETVTVTPLAPGIGWSDDSFEEKPNQNRALPNLSIAINALVGDQNSLYSLVLLGIPAGQTITDGGGHDHVSEGPNDQFNYATWNFNNFHLDPEGQTATFTITAVATTIDSDGNLSTSSSALLAVTDPAGVAGSDLNLGLAAVTPDPGTLVTVTVSDLPSGWTLSGAIQVDAHTWMVQTTDVQSLSVTTSSATLGAVVLEVHASWIAANGSTVSALIFDNVETFAPGSPIFALAVNDYLTGSDGADQFVFAQPIAHDVIYGFDLAQDTIDLLGFAGFSEFGDVAAHLVDDGFGNAVLTLADGATITINGVSASSLDSSNFHFNQKPVLTNAATFLIGDGAMLPIGGLIENSGIIALGSTGSETDLTIIKAGATLDGGGAIILSDSDANVISATAPDVTFNNVDNTISGAGQLGDGELILVNSGTINANGTHSLVINTGSESVVNSGILEASGTGGMVIESAVANSGTLWANGSTLTVQGAVSGSGSAIIDGAGTLDLVGQSSVNVAFGAEGAGKLVLGDSFHFNGTITGFGALDTIDLADFGSAATSVAYHANDAGTGGTLVVSDGVHVAELTLVGHYTIDDFSVANDPTVGVHIAYMQHALLA